MPMAETSLAKCDQCSRWWIRVISSVVLVAVLSCCLCMPCPVAGGGARKSVVCVYLSVITLHSRHGKIQVKLVPPAVDILLALYHYIYIIAGGRSGGVKYCIYIYYIYSRRSVWGGSSIAVCYSPQWRYRQRLYTTISSQPPKVDRAPATGLSLQVRVRSMSALE